MWMWFHTHINDTVFFKDWWIRDVGTMVWSCITIGLLGIGLEAIRSTASSFIYLFFILSLGLRNSKGNVSDKSFQMASVGFGKWYSHLLNSAHYKHVLLHVFHAVVAYTLMLVFMTFSVFLCISLCLGLATGHFLFGNR
ncbi:hypothetical protein Angca_004802, partial [Angiostrongylus cantonensis]